MIFIFYLCLLFFCPDTYSFFSTIPGENIWRMTSRIADCLEVTASKTCVIIVDSSNWTSLIELVDYTASLIDEQVFGIGNQFSSLQDILSSKILVIENSYMEIVFSDINNISTDLVSVSDAITIDLSVLDTTLGSLFENIETNIDSVSDVISTDLQTFSDCSLGTVLHQADFDANTLVIDTPGTYTLCEDVTSNFVPGINIQSNDVVLNLNGNTIFYGGFNGSAVFVSPTYQNISIKNGCLVATDVAALYGIQVNGASTVSIEDIYSNQLGVFIISSEAVSVSNYNGVGVNSSIVAQHSFNSVITQSSIIGDSLNGVPSVGVNVNGIGTAVVSEIFVSNATNGIFFEFNFNNYGLIQDCVVENISNIGYYALNIANDALIMDRCVAQSTATGFSVQNSVNVLLRDCIASESDVGIAVTASNNTVIKRASVANNTLGIQIDPTSLNTYVLDTCPVNNTTNIDDQGTNTVFINLETFAEILCSKIESFQGEAESILDTEDMYVLSFSDVIMTAIDTINSLFTCSLGTIIRQSDMPYTIPGPGVYTVCEPLTYNGGPAGTAAITNTFNDVVINLNGYSITTDNRAIALTTPGISNVMIKNGSIISGLEAIVANFAQSLFLDSIIVNLAAQVALRISNSDCIFVTNSAVYGNNGTSITGTTFPGAFYFQECGSVIVQECQAASVNGFALERGFSINGIDALGGFLVQNCTVSLANFEGFRVAETSGDLATVQLINCIASGTNTGISTVHTSGSNAGPYIESCEVNTCNDGFFIDRTSGVLLHKAIAVDNTNTGFFFDSATDEIVAVECVSHQNGVGFEIDGTRAVCDRSIATSNSAEGFLVSANAIGSIIYGALASRNNRGINDNNVAGIAIVDTRSQDPVFGINPAYNLNTNVDVKGAGAGSVIIRTS